jgi:hypothetical protein
MRNLPIRDGTIGGVGKIYVIPKKKAKLLKLNLNHIFVTENGFNYSNL